MVEPKHCDPSLDSLHYPSYTLFETKSKHVVYGKNLLFSLVKVGSVFPAFSGTSSLSGGCDSRSSFESLKNEIKSYFSFFFFRGINDHGRLGLPRTIPRLT